MRVVSETSTELQETAAATAAAAPDASPAERLRTGLKEMGPARLAAVGGLLLGLAGFGLFLALRLSAPDYALLFTELEPADAQTVVERLETMGVPYRLTADGTAVLVPEDKRLGLRMQFAQEGLPASGAVGYELFDERSLLGSTQFEANVNLLRALEGELSRTIASLDAVRTARVHLVQPKRQLFQRQSSRASASVALTLARRDGLGVEQVAAVRHLVAGAVPWLEPDQVTVVDERGQLLASEDEDEIGLLPGRAEAFQRGFEERLAQRVQTLLERSVGAGNVEVSVSAEIDFDQVTTTSEEYDPASQVARSTQTIEEESELVDQDAGAVTVQNNLPQPDPGGAEGPTSSERTTRTEETVNFEISRTVTNHVQSGGRVRRLSIAVLVDGSYATNAAGEVVYAPRDENELLAIAALVRSAVGFDAERGDVVEVVNRPFVVPEPTLVPEPGLFETAMGLWRAFGEALTLMLATLLVILFVARPLMRRAFPALPKPEPVLETESGLTVTKDGEVLVEPGSAAALAAEVEQKEEEMLQLNQIRGQIRASLLGRVTDLIDEHPDDATRVLRGWLQSE